MSHADEVREYCIANYVEPARKNKQKYVKIRSGDVHSALNYKNRFPLVCAALGTERFEQLARVNRVAIDGPLNSSNTLFTFQLHQAQPVFQSVEQQRTPTAEFKSWQSYALFADAVKRQNRFISTPDTEEFFQTVLATSANRRVELPKQKYLWRAQLGCGSRPIYHGDEYIADEPAPFPPDRMKPLPQQAKEGRANPKGIPYLYLATNKDTAMAEVRPRVGSLVSVSQFETVRDLAIIDCFLRETGLRVYFEEPDTEERERAVWADIERAFAKPVNETDQTADYIPTQIITELFKSKGFDGLAYKSALGDGFNITLFDLHDADPVNGSLYQAGAVNFTFEECANRYSIPKRSEKNENA